jgi:hypothetical protein
MITMRKKMKISQLSITKKDKNGKIIEEKIIGVKE